jgi:NADPH-dependent 2,4-dienoyl-CoA reductase/sulfur reductase-like enzyme
VVHAELVSHGVTLLTGTTVRAVTKAPPGSVGHLAVEAVTATGEAVTHVTDLVLVVMGVRPDTKLAVSAGPRQFAGSLGTQVVKIFGQAAARTGLRDHEARTAGFDPITVASEADDHKTCYPGNHRIAMRFTAAPAVSWAPSCSATRTPRSPSASTPSPPPSSTT